jgi:hypothetical protein
VPVLPIVPVPVVPVLPGPCGGGFPAAPPWPPIWFDCGASELLSSARSIASGGRGSAATACVAASPSNDAHATTLRENRIWTWSFMMQSSNSQPAPWAASYQGKGCSLGPRPSYKFRMACGAATRTKPFVSLAWPATFVSAPSRPWAIWLNRGGEPGSVLVEETVRVLWLMMRIRNVCSRPLINPESADCVTCKYCAASVQFPVLGPLQQVAWRSEGCKE